MKKAQFDHAKIVTINIQIKKFLDNQEDFFSTIQDKRVPVDTLTLMEKSLRDRANLYEEHLVKANIVKDAATKESATILRMLNSAKLILKISEGLFRTGEADTFLREMGFPKLTESLRDAAVFSVPALNELREHISRLEEMMRFIEKYEWYLKEDESTMKSLLESLNNRPML
ncbi:hypothetical protein [Bdellovibrio sp. BCCA]|uniref:hypothetical protein n=1 Tax=Bdellovibrio sp. BCCA TaxID=3136281 RepID=UPI0030F22018